MNQHTTSYKPSAPITTLTSHFMIEVTDCCEIFLFVKIGCIRMGLTSVFPHVRFCFQVAAVRTSRTQLLIEVMQPVSKITWNLQNCAHRRQLENMCLQRRNVVFVTVSLHYWQLLFRNVEFSYRSNCFPLFSWDDQNLPCADPFLRKYHSKGAVSVRTAVPLYRYVRWSWLNTYVRKMAIGMRPITHDTPTVNKSGVKCCKLSCTTHLSIDFVYIIDIVYQASCLARFARANLHYVHPTYI